MMMMYCTYSKLQIQIGASYDHCMYCTTVLTAYPLLRFVFFKYFYLFTLIIRDGQPFATWALVFPTNIIYILSHPTTHQSVVDGLLSLMSKHTAQWTNKPKFHMLPHLTESRLNKATLQGRVCALEETLVTDCLFSVVVHNT